MRTPEIPDASEATRKLNRLRRLRAAMRPVWIVGLLFMTAIAVYWTSQMVMRVPAAYPGEHRAANVLMSIAAAMLCGSHLVPSMRSRRIVMNGVWLSMLAALLVVALSGK